jgi:hypothetical protein
MGLSKICFFLCDELGLPTAQTQGDYYSLGDFVR